MNVPVNASVQRTRRRLASVLAGAMLVATPIAVTAPASAAPTGTQAQQQGPSAAADDDLSRSEYRRPIHRRTNEIRANRDLATLPYQACLNQKAQQWAVHLARTRTFEHQALGPVLDDCNLNLAGENIARGYATGQAAVQGWWQSPPHRDNLLEPRYRMIGVGAADGPDGWVAVQVFGRAG